VQQLLHKFVERKGGRVFFAFSPSGFRTYAEETANLSEYLYAGPAWADTAHLERKALGVYEQSSDAPPALASASYLLRA